MREGSADYLLYAESDLDAAIEWDSLEAFEESFAIVEPALTRVRRTLKDQYGFEKAWELHRRFLAQSPEEALAGFVIWRRAAEIGWDDELPYSTRVDALRSARSELESLDVPIKTALLSLRIGDLENDRGNVDAQREALRHCIAVGERTGDYVILCQALGVLGSLSQTGGDIAGMHEHWNRGLGTAVQHRLPEQTGRLLSFFANYYRSLGRLSLARTLLHEADRQCESFGGSPNDIRFLEDLLSFNADLGCWDVVETNLRRAPLQLERFAEWRRSRKFIAVRTAGIQQLQARAAVAAGGHREADDLFRDSEGVFLEWSQRGNLSWLRSQWAHALIDGGRASEALTILDRGLEDPSSPRLLVRMLASKARAHADLADWDACERELSLLRQLWEEGLTPSLEVSTLCNTLAIRVARARGDTPGALEAIRAACSDLGTHLSKMESTQEDLLSLHQIQILHEELFEIVHSFPVLAYEFEVEWLQIPGTVGQSAHPALESPVAACARIASSALGSSPSLPDQKLVPKSGLDSSAPMELLYRAGADSLERWCRVEGQLAHGSSPVSRPDLEARVTRVLREMESSPADGASPPGWLTEELHELAKHILPEALLDAARQGSPTTREIRIRTCGTLDGLPFGILNLSADGYLPLIAHFDPVYLGPGGTGAADGSGTGLIVADPELDPTDAGWQTGLSRLEHGVAEARALHEWKPDSILLEREAATKTAVLRSWRSAPFIYFASHVVQDPAAPYLSFIPLSAPPVEYGQAVRREDTYLDVLDVRTARLMASPLVVLSACSSGAPYRARGTHIPGLGSAFLEAGASTVIQNCWSVRDDVAAELMQMAMRAWALDEVDPATALNEARRQMAGEGAFTHPYFWGSSVVLTGTR